MINMDHYASAAVGMGMSPLLPKSMKRQPVIRVKNVSISDVFTHQIIFQRVYSWKATTAFSNLGNLIESFYQFSRTVDDGGVVGIDFESTSKDNLRRRRDDPLWDVRGDTMHMMTMKTSDFTVTAFYDLSGRILVSAEEEKKFKTYLYTVKIAFEHLYMEALQTIRNQHQLLCQQRPDEPIVLNTAIFADFMPIVDAIHELVFNNSPTNSMNPNRSGTNMNGVPLYFNGNSGQAQNLHHLRDEHQLDKWLMTPNESQPLSVEEEVRLVLENINIFLPEIILDRIIPPLPGSNTSNQQPSQGPNAGNNNTPQDG